MRVETDGISEALSFYGLQKSSNTQNIQFQLCISALELFPSFNLTKEST